MENTPVLHDDQKKSGERKLFFWIFWGLGLLALLFFIVIPKLKPHFVPIPISQTAGMNANAEFQFTLSPDNRWILYFEQKYPYYDQYNLIAFDTVSNKKFTIDTGDISTVGLQMQIQNNCWSKDSHYCVLPIPKSSQDPTILEREKSVVTLSPQSPWLTGNQLGESQFADTGGVVGYINNAPDILIDFTNPVGPILKKQYFDYRLVDMTYRNQNIPFQNNRLIFDQISYGGFDCSDCSGLVNKEKDFGGNSHGREYTSPDGRFVAQEISHGNSSGFFTPPDLYITDTKTGSKNFITHNVYYDMHFTSDSNGLYFYGCKNGGACNPETENLFFVDLTKKTKTNNNTNESPIVTSHTQEERGRDLGAIMQKEKEAQKAVLKAHYDLLQEEFRVPQKIIGINGVRLITEHYRRILLINNLDNMPGSGLEKDQKLETLVKSLIGKKVTIVLQPFDEFKKTYDGGIYPDGRDKYDIGFFGTEVWVYDANGKEVIHVSTPVDPTYKKYIGTSYADVYNGSVL